MDERKIITAQNESDIWTSINEDFSSGVPHDYHVKIQYNEKNIKLDVVSSPGGNNEGGYEYTKLRADLPTASNFEFIIQPEDFLNRIGKLFGGQDVILGYPEFDNNVLVRTNDPERLKALLANDEIRKPFVTMSGYSFGIVTESDNGQKTLELLVQRIVAGNELKDAFDAFNKVIDALNNL